MDARAQADELKEKHSETPREQRPTIEVKGEKLFINKELQKNPIPPPQPNDMLILDQAERQKMDKITFTQTNTQGEKGSVFRGVAAKVSNRAEARRAYKKVRRVFPAATHIMCAYAFKKPNSDIEYGKQDDGEWGGAHRIMEVLKTNNTVNTIVFVVREFGGVEIGGKRFEHIKQCTEKVLEKM